jgi:hypothetical protein
MNLGHCCTNVTQGHCCATVCSSSASSRYCCPTFCSNNRTSLPIVAQLDPYSSGLPTSLEGHDRQTHGSTLKVFFAHARAWRTPKSFNIVLQAEYGLFTLRTKFWTTYWFCLKFVHRHRRRLPWIGRGLLAIVHLEGIQQEVNVPRHDTNRISNGI